MAGIQNIKEAVLFVIELGEGIVKIAEDGKFEITDLMHLVPAAKALPAAFSDYDQIPAEYKDLDQPERAELKQYVVDEFDIPKDNVETFIEEAFAVLLDLAKLIEKMGNLKSEEPE